MRKRSLLLTMVLFVLLSQGCKLVPSFETHELKKKKSVQLTQLTDHWQFYDINQDDIDELIFDEPYKPDWQPLMVADQNLNIFSQLNMPYQLISFSVVYNKFDKQNWLFYCFNNEKQCYMRGELYTWDKALKRETYHYQPIERTDQYINDKRIKWYGSMTPRMIEDINEDTVAELICLGSDSFTSNPRGLFVYNLLSGKLLWQVDTAGTIKSILYEDFNLDGVKDFIISTSALKNHRQIINGTTDFNTSILVCDNMGKILYQQNNTEGFGSTMLAADDLDGDSKNEVIRIDQTWGKDDTKNQIYTLGMNGNSFTQRKIFETESPVIRKYEKILISSLSQSAEKHIIIADKKNGLIVLNKDLNPVNLGTNYQVTDIEAVEDLDNDNKKEIIILDENDNYVFLNNTFQVTTKIRNPYRGESGTKFFIIKNGSELPPRIAITSHTGITYYDYVKLPLHVRIIRFVKAVIYLITAALIFMLIFSQIRYIRQKNMYTILSNQTQTGIMHVTKKRIYFVNHYMQDYLFNCHNIIDIKMSLFKSEYPELLKEILLFIKSKSLSSAKEISLGGDEKTRYQLFMHKLKGIPNKTLVLLTRITANTEQVADKLEWAVTSRRLAHHVRRHLTNILNSLYLIDSEASKEEQNKYIEIIRAEVEDVRLFTHAFQRFTELGEYKLQEVDIVPYVENSIKKFIIPPNIRLIKDWTLKSLTAKIETTRFEEVITNLVTNAVDAMQGGGVLKISLSEKKEPDGKNYVLVEVEDTGQGIPKDKLEEIWEPFYTTKQNGTGIGLPEVKKTLRSMQAEIDLISEEGVGTTVSILLKGAEV